MPREALQRRLDASERWRAEHAAFATASAATLSPAQMKERRGLLLGLEVVRRVAARAGLIATAGVATTGNAARPSPSRGVER